MLCYPHAPVVDANAARSISSPLWHAAPAEEHTEPGSEACCAHQSRFPGRETGRALHFLSTFLDCHAHGLQELCTGEPGLDPQSIVPTVGLNVGRLEAHHALLLFWDLGGAAGLRSIWDKYYADSHALIYVVDSTRPAR